MSVSLKTYGVNDAAKALHVHANRILEWAASKQLRGVKLGRAWVFREEDLISFLDQRIREAHDMRQLS